MSTIEPWVRALDRAAIELFQKLGQAMNNKPTRPPVIIGTALGICHFWLRKLEIPDFDASTRGEIEQALVVRVARRFTLGMELKSWEDRATVDARVEQTLREVSQVTVDRLAFAVESADAKDNRFYTLAQLITMDLMDREKVPPMTVDGWTEYMLCSLDVMKLAFTSISIVNDAVESARTHT